MKLKQVIRNNEPATITMYKFEFQNVGTKKKSNFQFNLELKEGRVINDISGSVAAKELSEMLKLDANVRPLLNTGHFTFSLNGEFAFTIQKNES